MPNLGLSLGLQFNRLLNSIVNAAKQIVNAFILRVSADGGTFEAYNCMVNTIQSLLNIDLYPIGDAVALELKDRATLDGGIFEAYNCLAQSMQLLADIDLYPVGDAVMIALRDRAIADSGTFEAYNCGIIAVQSLANIEI